jgi:hypothetical protein
MEEFPCSCIWIDFFWLAVADVRREDEDAKQRSGGGSDQVGFHGGNASSGAIYNQTVARVSIRCIELNQSSYYLPRQ